MNSLIHIATAFCLSLVACINMQAQTDYKAKGMEFVAKGKYSEAKALFEAQRTVMDVKKENKNSVDYIDIEKKISRANDCIKLSKDAESRIGSIITTSMQGAFAECRSEEEADETQRKYYNMIDEATMALKQITLAFPSDKVSEDNLKKCTKYKDLIAELRREYSTKNNSQSISSTQLTFHHDSIKEIADNIGENEEDTEAIPFQLVEEKPKFNDGDVNEFSKWVNSNLVYPADAKVNGIRGRVMIQFTIKSDGSVSDIKIIRGVDPSLDKEAVRVVSSSPKWAPGRQKGRAVGVIYSFPVVFVLN